jgi:hypothetical protein
MYRPCVDRACGSDAVQMPFAAKSLEVALVQMQRQLMDCIVEQGQRLESAVVEQKRMMEALVTCFQSAPPPTRLRSPRGEEVPEIQMSTPVHQPLGEEAVEIQLEPDTTEIKKSQAIQTPNALSSEAEAMTQPGSASDHAGILVRDFEYPLSPPAVSNGLAKLAHFRKSATVPAPTLTPGSHPIRTWLLAFLSDRRFELFVGLIILLNGFVILLEADWTARHNVTTMPIVYTVLDTMFFLAFLFELVLRIWVLRMHFFCGPERRWNWFDAAVVFSATVEEITKLVMTSRKNLAARNVTLLRVMRIMKLSRVIRMVRVFKVFRELRIMLASIGATLITLFWSVVCLSMITSCFSVFFITIVSDHQISVGRDTSLDEYFGSMPQVMILLFQATTGGVDWRTVSDILWRISSISVVVFCGYISMMVYCVMNILTGICVNTANTTAENDFQVSMHEERMRHNNVVVKLTKTLHAAATDGSGLISWPELEAHLEEPSVRNHFKRLDLEPWHLHSFFDLLKAGEGQKEPQISIDHLIRGCMRMRVNVKNIDLMVSDHEQLNDWTKKVVRAKRQS